MPLFGSAPMPPAPPPIPPAAHPATAAAAPVVSAGQNARQRAMGALAEQGVNPTGGKGLTAPATAKTTLLGD